MSYGKEVMNEKKCRQAIMDIQRLQNKYRHTDTIVVYNALAHALDKLGWSMSLVMGGGDKDGNCREKKKYPKVRK